MSTAEEEDFAPTADPVEEEPLPLLEAEAGLCCATVRRELRSAPGVPALAGPAPPAWEPDSNSTEAAELASPFRVTVWITTGDGREVELAWLSELRLRRCLRDEDLRLVRPADLGRIFWWPLDPIQDPFWELCRRGWGVGGVGGGGRGGREGR